MKTKTKVLLRMALCLLMVGIMFISSTTTALAVNVNKHDESNATKGNATWSYHYVYNKERDQLEVVGTRSSDGKQYNFYEYEQKYGKIPAQNAQRESGYTTICGFPMDLTGCPYTAQQVEDAIARWAAANGVDMTTAMMKLAGQSNFMISLADLPGDGGGDPWERTIPDEKSGEFYKTEKDSVWRLVSLEASIDAKQLNVQNDKIDYNKKESTGDSKSKSNSIGSAASAYAGVPDLQLKFEHPTYYKAKTTSTATYIKVWRYRYYKRNIKYWLDTWDTTDSEGNVTHHSAWREYSPRQYTAWSLYDTKYTFGETTTDVKTNSYDANIKDPEMKEMKCLDLTSQSYRSTGDLNVDGVASSRIKDTSGTGNIAASITDKSGLNAGEKFSITSENIPQSWEITNQGWWGITSAAGPGSLSLGDESPDGNVGHQFISEATLHYGPYTAENESVKRCSIELFTDGASQGEKSAEDKFTITSGSGVNKALFKERSIKYGTDYKLGYRNANCFWVFTTCNRQNHEGYDVKCKASGNSISHSCTKTKGNYNNIILVADFIQPYLYGEFEVKDIAGSNH